MADTPNRAADAARATRADMRDPLRIFRDPMDTALTRLRAAMAEVPEPNAPSSVCSFCGERITLHGGHWTTEDGTTACTDTTTPYVPHKPMEDR